MRILSFLALGIFCFLTSCRSKSMVEEANERGWYLWEYGAEVRTLDPQLSTEVNSGYVINALFEGLVMSDPKTSLPAKLGAARDWEISEDRLTYTFHLRPNGSWSNGVPVTAHHFLYSYERILSAKLGAKNSYMLFPIKNAQQYLAGEITDFKEVGVKVIDDLTLQITLHSPTPYLLDLMTHTSWFPVYPPAVEKHGGMLNQINAWSREKNIIGNGAYKMKDWLPNAYLEVEKRNDYWSAEKVSINGIRFIPIDNIESAARAYRRDALHRTEVIPPHRINWALKNRPDEVRISEYLGVYYYRFNISPPKSGESPERAAAREALRKKKVRQALAYSMDRASICHFLKAGQKPAFNFVPPNTGGYTGPQLLSYDPDKARKLLAEAGYPDGKDFPTIELFYNTQESHRQIAEILQSQWKEALGINVTLANQEWKVFNNTLHSMDYEFARSAWIGDYNDPNTFLDLWLSESGNNETGFKNPEYDKLIKDAAMAGAEPEKRLGLFRKAEELLMEELPVIPVYFYVSRHMVHPSIEGWYDNVLDKHHPRFLTLKR